MYDSGYIEIFNQYLKEEKNASANTLSSFLGQKKVYRRLEAYDISNTNGVDSIGAMVVFEDFKPV